MSNPLFSILIANYNNGKYFEDCYKSLLAQTYPNWEAIIVDDCSSDNSLELIKKLIGEDNRFKLYVNEENHGCGYTKRRCAELANGELCGFVDPDDAITSDALEVMVKAHYENPNHSIVYSQFIYCNDKLEPQQKFITGQVPNQDAYFFNFNGRITHFASFKNAFYQKTIGINPHLKRAVDQDLYLKLYDVAPVFFIDKHLYLYRIHGTGISTNNNSFKAHINHWKVIFERAEARGVEIEPLFQECFTSRKEAEAKEQQNQKLRDLLKKSRWLKLGAKLGLFKGYKYL